MVARRKYTPEDDTITLASLAGSKRWVAWRIEDRDGRPSKIPYSPITGRMARIPTEPSGYGNRADAEALWRKLNEGKGGGVGIVLGDIEGVCLWGIDLDGCIEPNAAELAPWAGEVLNRFNTYGEASPSGRGLKLIFQADPAWAELLGKNASGEPKTRASFAAGEHRELALDRARYYAVTENRLGPVTLRKVDVKDVRWLVESAGPEYLKSQATGDASKSENASTSRDESGSGHGFRFMQERKRAGDTFDAAVTAIKADTNQAGEWARRVDDRQLQRAWDNSASTGSDPNAIVLPAGVPVAAAEAFVQHLHTLGGVRLLHHYRGAFYLWTGTHYKVHSEEALVRDLYGFLNTALTTASNGSIVPFNPNRAKITNILHALHHGVLVPDDLDVPFWLGPKSGPAPNLVACRNGILNLSTRELVPHDPSFFTTGALPLDYDPDAPAPQRWKLFLEQLWPADESDNWDKEAEDTLQEMFGYLLTPDTRQQKLFLIVGPKRGGKGTIVFVLEHLLGTENVVYQNLGSMKGEFGRWPLIDKKLAVIADARLSSADTHGVAETLLSISGGDPQTINRKLQSFWTGKLGVRFLITTNVLPAIRDASGTIASRFILLKLTESFYGREDTSLQPALLPELSGILNWALDGLLRLRKRGHFRQPQSSAEAIRLLEDLAAPVIAFVRDWCNTEPDDRINVKELYRAYRSWADETGQKAVSASIFGKELRDAVPTLRTTGTGAKRAYVGVALSEAGTEAFEALLQEKGKR